MAFSKLREYFTQRYEKIQDDKYRCIALLIYYGYCLGITVAIGILAPNLIASVIRTLILS